MGIVTWLRKKKQVVAKAYASTCEGHCNYLPLKWQMLLNEGSKLHEDSQGEYEGR